jgi:hypothetical protein
MVEKTLQTLAKSFDYLIAEGFHKQETRVTGSLGNQSIEFRSTFSRILVGTDRGSVYVLATPNLIGEDCWIDLPTLVSYLTGSEVDDIYQAYGISFQTELPYDEMVVTQALGLAKVLKLYLERIRDLFASHQAESICADLVTFGKARLERRAGL